MERVAAAVHTEVSRLLGRETLETSWEKFADLDAAFEAAPDFANVPTVFLVLPTRSRWTVLWNNSFLCDGYDSLCWCLTNTHHFTTIHWSAHDEWTTFQAGAAYHHRRWDGAKVVQRSVEVVQHDKSWTFYENGEPLPEEDVVGYRERKKRDRLNETHMVDLLARLGASPWREEFYALADAPAFVLARTAVEATLLRRSREEVLRPQPDVELARTRGRRLSARG